MIPGRNQPCPCQSGKKFKHCHGHPAAPVNEFNTPPEVARRLRLNAHRNQARQAEIEGQFGKGRAPIALKVGERWVVAVGDEILHSTKWKTFPDFLTEYFKHVLGAQWGNAQLAKPLAEASPLFQWYVQHCNYQAQQIKIPGEVVESPIIGATHGILWLTYGLYLLRHNAAVQKRLLERLRSSDAVQVIAAVYEVLVATTMIWAGFDLELEDETDGRRSHCEFTATSRRTGKKYSVEAKVCDPGHDGSGNGGRVFRQFSRAMHKQADHPRIIFIDLNRPCHGDGAEGESMRLLDIANRFIYRQENSFRVRGQIPEPAYYLLTLFPYRFHLGDVGVGRAISMDAFKIPELRHGRPFYSLKEMSDVRKQHKDIWDIRDAFGAMKIPITLDGQLPSRAFGKKGDPIQIGEQYQFVNDDGSVIFGELVQAFANEENKSVTALIRTNAGGDVLLRLPLSDDDLAIYRDSPETFFGKLERKRTLTEPVDMYDWLMETYQNSNRDKLIEWLSEHRPVEELRSLTTLQLAEIYCEGIAWSMAKDRAHKPGSEIREAAAGSNRQSPK